LEARTLYIYVDESGNFDFSKTGTKHFVMAAFATQSPLEGVIKFASLKYSLLESGVNIPNFHASEDSQLVRNQVFDAISGLLDATSYTFWIRKDDPQFSGKGVNDIYEIFGREIGKAAMVESRKRNILTVVIVFDKVLKHREQQSFLSRAKTEFSKSNQKFHIYFHNVSKDFNGQIADYLAWAHYVSLERNELRPLASLPAPLRGSSRISQFSAQQK